jgi:DNA-binding NarL/FixJ family response regulator
MPAVVFLSSDLMFTSRLLGAAQALGSRIQVIANPADLPRKLDQDCRLVLVDLSLGGLDLPATVRAVKEHSPQARIVAFGPHVDEATLAGAEQAGCDLVLSRGQFNKQYVELLRSAIPE